MASGRDSDATIIFMDDLRSRLANRVPTKQVTVTRRTLPLLTKGPWEMGDIVDVLETWEAATVALPVNEGLRQTFLYARRRTRRCTCRCAFSSHPGSVPTS